MRCATATALVLVLVFQFAAAPRASAGDPPPDVAQALADVSKLRKGGDLEGAAKQVADLVAKHPNVLEVQLANQDVQLALGRDKETLETYRNAANAADATADAHYLCARLLRGGAAITEFRNALKVDPQHFWSMCGIAAELTRAKNYTDAKAALDDATKLRPDSAVPLNGMGRIEEARGKTAEAEKWYRAAIALDPTMTIARVNLGAVLAATARAPEAVKTLTEAAQLAPKDPTPLVGLGMAQLAAKDARAAADSFRRAAALAGDDVASLNFVATAYIDQEQYELAEEVLQRALKKAPANVTTNVSLAYVRVKKENYDEALKFATAAVQADESSGEAHYVLGLVYDHQIQSKKAEAEFRRAVKLDDDNPAFARGLGAFAEGMGDWKTAVGEFQRACKLTGNSVDSLMDLAQAYVGANRGSEAAKTYEQVLAVEPGKLEAMLQLGIVLHRDLKEFKRASKVFHDYVAKGGKDPRVPLWIAQLDAK
jgi:tetratricopeptide (TPR) repeat protein